MKPYKREEEYFKKYDENIQGHCAPHFFALNLFPFGILPCMQKNFSVEEIQKLPSPQKIRSLKIISCPGALICLKKDRIKCLKFSIRASVIEIRYNKNYVW